MSVYNPTSHHCMVALDDQLAPNLHRDEVDGSHLARFLAATIAALPTAYAPNRFRQLPLCPTARAIRSYTRQPPKIQSLAALASPNPRPVNTRTVMVARSSLKYATEPLWRKSSTPIPANVRETMLVRTEEVLRVFIGCNLPNT